MERGPFTNENRYAAGTRYGNLFYLVFAAIAIGLTMILVLWIISYMILKWKRENNGEEYVLRLKIYSILFTMQAFIFRKNFVEK